MAHPLPSTAAAAPRHPLNFPAADSLRQIKQNHARLLRNPHIPDHNKHLMHLLISSLSFPSYALSLLSSTIFYRPQPGQLASELLKHLYRSNNPEDTFIFFQTMQNKAFRINSYSFPPLLKAAAKTGAFSEGEMVHGLAVKLGYASDPYVEFTLVEMYAACGLISEARLVFDKMSHREVSVWTVMIQGYCQRGLFDSALALLEEMKSSNTAPDGRVFTTILSACSRFENLEIGKLVHGFISENNIQVDYLLQSALLKMYASSGAMDVAQSLYDKLQPKNVEDSKAMLHGYRKVGNLEAARLLFDEMVDKDWTCWKMMISDYAQSDKPQEALKVFQDVQRHGIKPDQFTMRRVISACARLGALDQAKKIHLFVDDQGLGNDLRINNALIDMYAKCGSLEDAKRVFGRMDRKNVVSWTSMVGAFAIHGDVDNALKYFQQMKSENVDPNWVTFVCVLRACSHAGLVEEGKRAFDSMVNDYEITPTLEHYGCMVDLYGRANRLKDALEIVQSMPIAPDVVIWRSLLAACKSHGEFELGEFAAQRLLELDPKNDVARVVLSNAGAIRRHMKERGWESAEAIRQHMKDRGILKDHTNNLFNESME